MVESRQKLEEFLRFYIPTGWVGPISEFTHPPYISEDMWDFY